MNKILGALLIFSILNAQSAFACKVAFPNELRCESQTTVPVSLARLHSLKKSVERFYNQRERFITAREKQLSAVQLSKLSRSSCFNLRHAEMYLNILLQMGQKSNRLCKDHVLMMVDSVEQMIQFKSEENEFIKNSKHKTMLIDQAMDVTSLIEAVKLETERP